MRRQGRLIKFASDEDLGTHEPVTEPLSIRQNVKRLVACSMAIRGHVRAWRDAGTIGLPIGEVVIVVLRHESSLGNGEDKQLRHISGRTAPSAECTADTPRHPLDNFVVLEF